MINWETLKLGDTVNIAEYMTYEKGDCPVELLDKDGIFFCCRHNEHNGQHVSINRFGFVFKIWETPARTKLSQREGK